MRWQEGGKICDKNKLKKITDDVVKAVLSVTSKVDSIILYGSQARGDSVDGSDIDILVIIDSKWYPVELKYKTRGCKKNSRQ